jgi:hypothetical protein
MLNSVAQTAAHNATFCGTDCCTQCYILWHRLLHTMLIPTGAQYGRSFLTGENKVTFRVRVYTANASYSATNGPSLCTASCSLVTCTPPPKLYDSSNAVAHSVEALRYKQGRRRFDSRWWHSGADTASNINDYQGYLLGGKGGRYAGLTTLPPSCSVLKCGSLQQGLLHLLQQFTSSEAGQQQGLAITAVSLHLTSPVLVVLLKTHELTIQQTHNWNSISKMSSGNSNTVLSGMVYRSAVSVQTAEDMKCTVLYLGTVSAL